MHPKDAIGRYGEQLAAHHLRRTGLTLLARNWRCPEGEVDIVARDGDVLVFCEVKTRSSTAFGWPAEAVGSAKAATAPEARSLLSHRAAPDDASWILAGRPVRRGSVVQERSGVAQVEHLRGVL
jgi:putative endonuclease